MTMFLLLIGVACVVYASCDRRRKMLFRELLDDADIEMEDFEVEPLHNKVDYADRNGMEQEFRLIEEELENLRAFEKSMESRMVSMEGVFKELTGRGQIIQSMSKSDFQKFRDAHVDQHDFDEKSLEELSSETGLKKGELLLLKRLSQK